MPVKLLTLRLSLQKLKLRVVWKAEGSEWEREGGRGREREWERESERKIREWNEGCSYWGELKSKFPLNM